MSKHIANKSLSFKQIWDGVTNLTDRLHNNINPFGYVLPGKKGEQIGVYDRLRSAIFENKKEASRRFHENSSSPESRETLDMHSLYLGKTPKYNALPKSLYKDNNVSSPTVEKKIKSVFGHLDGKVKNVAELEQAVKSIIDSKKRGISSASDPYTSSLKNVALPVLGHADLNIGEDDDGRMYVEYNDEWNLNAWRTGGNAYPQDESIMGRILRKSPIALIPDLSFGYYNTQDINGRVYIGRSNKKDNSNGGFFNYLSDWFKDDKEGKVQGQIQITPKVVEKINATKKITRPPTTEEELQKRLISVNQQLTELQSTVGK